MSDAFSTFPCDFGRYRVLRQLGKGGMGTVYLAEDAKLGNRKVALKFPAEQLSDDNARRFVREAQAAAVLDHPNICPVYDIDTAHGRLYLAMKYVAGRPLADEIGPARPWDGVRAARLVRIIAGAMHYAHENRVVHRDLKPVNVMLTAAGEPIVMDFGLAKLEDATTLTFDGAVFGTPAYMPLEQARGETHEIGPWSDVYSLGVVLFELVTGRRPFGGKPLEIVAQLATAPTPPLRKFRTDACAGLERICLRAMGKQPVDRYPSMAPLMADLDEYLQAPANDRPHVASRTVPQHSALVREPGDRMILALPDRGEMKFAWCPPGMYMMGATDNDFDADADEKPRHPVQISRGFYLGAYEVTRRQFEQFADATGYATEAEKGLGGYAYLRGAWQTDSAITWRTPGYRQTDEHPAVVLSWNDAQAYAAWLNGIRPGYNFRLPTEAEWEYACRAGTAWRYLSGNAPSSLTAHTNVANPAKRTTAATPPEEFEEDYVFTSPVGRYLPNDWGLYDMVGNVWEWCADWYDANFYAGSPTVDPANTTPSPRRVCRGGSGGNNAVVCRASYRNRYEPDRCVTILGFRLAFSPA